MKLGQESSWRALASGPFCGAKGKEKNKGSEAIASKGISNNEGVGRFPIQASFHTFELGK